MRKDKNKTNGQLTDADETRTNVVHELERISRDEMHLATYPIALLTYQSNKDAVIIQTRQRRHPITKKPITATWHVEGGAEIGLPTAGDEGVILVLLELTREQGWSQDVYFSLADMLERLGWPDNQVSYEKLKLALRRLASVTIHSQNALWDKTAKAFISNTIHVLAEANVLEKRGRKRRAKGELSEVKAMELSLSHVRWSKAMWRSFKDGHLKPISLDTYFTLHLPLARRLYRFLDLKKYDGKPIFRIGLRKLCEEYLGVSQNKYLSYYKKVLQPAHDELVKIGFLDRVFYEEARGEGENTIYVFKTAVVNAPLSAGTDLPQLPSQLAKTETEACDAVLERLQKEEPEEYSRIEREARDLVGDIEKAMLERDPQSPPALHTMREHMRTIVVFDYRYEVEEVMEQ